MAGNVKNYGKDKGYEIIPRELLQNDKLSLQAIGLLCNLQSYPESWELHKTEVYKRFSKNKKTSVMNAWDELVNTKYIAQLKRRDGRKWEYIYYFNLYPFTDEQIKEIENKEQAKCVSFRKTEAQKNNNLGFRFSEAQNGKPKMGSSKPADNIITQEDITQEDITQEDITYSSSSAEEKPHFENQSTDPMYDFQTKEEEEEKKETNKLYKQLKDFLVNKGVKKNTISRTLTALKENDLVEFSMVDAQKQFEHMIMKSQTQRIYDFATYFANGLNQLNEIKESKSPINDIDQDRDTSFYYNWLEQ